MGDPALDRLLAAAARFSVTAHGLEHFGVDDFVHRRWLRLPVADRHAFVDEALLYSFETWVALARGMPRRERDQLLSVALIVESTRLLRRLRRAARPMTGADAAAFARRANRAWPRPGLLRRLFAETCIVRDRLAGSGRWPKLTTELARELAEREARERELALCRDPEARAAEGARELEAATREALAALAAAGEADDD